MAAPDASMQTIEPASRLNIWRLPSGEACVRPGLRKVYAPDNGRELVGGASIQNNYTGEWWHYVLDVSTSGARALRLQILDEDFGVFQTAAINADVVPRDVSIGVIQDQIMISGVDFGTRWGCVGSGVYLAVKVASDNTATTAIPVPRGIGSVWCNRWVECFGTSMFVSDPIDATGGSPRTFVAENQNQRPGIVYGVHEAAGGMLVVVTGAGVYGLDSDAAAVQIVGSNGTGWRMLNHHRATSYRSSCVVRGRVYALTKEGIALVDVENDEERFLSDPVMPRAFGPRISVPDFREASIFAGDEGPYVAVESQNAVWRLDVATGSASWWRSAYTPTDFRMRGLLRDIDGTQMMMCANGVFRMMGNFDGDTALSSAVATQPKGVMFSQVPSDTASKTTVRNVHVAAASGGASGARIWGAVRGKIGGAGAGARPQADTQGITIGTDAWGTTTKRYTSTPLSSARFDFAQDSNDQCVEAASELCLTRISAAVDVETIDTKRPGVVG